MCGIFALFLNRPLSEDDIRLGRSGTKALAHRGPDGSGEWIDRAAGVFLGHRRLAIIDPTSASDQPMSQAGLTCTYNGEIYNYVGLRHSLGGDTAGFKTDGDVEVLLRAWRKWGPQSLDKFDGMFAFALWDGEIAHVTTDPFGEKPLFLALTKDGVYLSSEIQPLATLLDLKPKFDAGAIAAYLTLGYVPPPRTAYPAIERIGAARHLIIKDGTVTHQRQYWLPPIAEPGHGRALPLAENQLDQIQEVLGQSIKRRLRADVPLCMFLSQGIDSALVAAIARRDFGSDLKSLTVSYPDGNRIDESVGAARIAGALGIEHQIIKTEAAPVDTTPSAVLEIYGQPAESVTAVSIRAMSKAAAEHYKVALTGMGGDEAFSGYGKVAHAYRWRNLYDLPQTARLTLGRLGGLGAGLHPFLNRLAIEFGVADHERFAALKNLPTIGNLRSLGGFSEWAEQEFAAKPDNFAAWVAWYELTSVMPGLRLMTFDHSSMKESLELRTPFLSRELIETVTAFDPRSLMAFGQKDVLRRLLERYLPRELFDFPKTGFIFPTDLYLKLHGHQKPEISGIEPAFIERVWQKKEQGGGWPRIAIRLLHLHHFLANHA